ncbi:hypothetical protein [Cryptosporangium aurantiacum]|uniref:hypothetical protein n=1 Tax=Cryptosporangium aurantiacum TaxID=134849 RepID=UPI0011613F26|nr:hypothetical protein [Cryptosporangium aurantiacum]
MVVVLLLAAGACGGSDPEPDAKPPTTPRIALADGAAVSVRAADGKVTRVAALPAGWRAEALQWSGDGSELTWVAGKPDLSESRIYRAAVTGNPVRHWECTVFCGSQAFLGADLVGEGSLGGPDTYPRAGGEPQAFESDGLPAGFDLSGGPTYLGLLAGAPKGDAIYFVAARSIDSPKTVYRVGSDRKATVAFEEKSTSVPINGTVSPDGAQLAYTLDKAGTTCPATDSVVVVNLRSRGTVTLTPPPSTAALFVAGLWFDAEGKLFVAYVPGPIPCRPELAEQPETPTHSTAATVYERGGNAWKETDRKAQDGADLGDRRVLELTGPLTVAPGGIRRSSGATLQVVEDGKAEVIGRDVNTFAVAPK